MGFFSRLFGPKVDLKEKIKAGALVIDVRTKSEYSSGHLEGSLNIPLDVLDSQLEALKSKNKIIISCCASGVRSSMAKAKLNSKGIEAYNGGSWTKVQKLF